MLSHLRIRLYRERGGTLVRESAAAGLARPVGSRGVHVTLCTHRTRCDGLDRVLRSDSGQASPSASHRGARAAPQMGTSRRYWTEFVFEGYVNHRPGAIYLEGLPDVPESRPHSRDYVPRAHGH